MYRNKKSKLVFLALFMLYAVSAQAIGGYSLLPDHSTREKPQADNVFIRETADKTVMPFGYTSPEMLFAAALGRVNTDGLRQLRASYSGQFAPQELDFIRARIGAHELVIIDLREDNHFFLNGYAVRMDSDGKIDEQQLFKKIYGLKVTIKPEKRFILSNARRDFAPQTAETLMTEQQLCERNDIRYFQIKNTDTSARLRQFAEIVATLPATTWVHIHDEDAKNAPLYFAVLDAINNCQKAGIDDIISRNSVLNKQIYSAEQKNILKNFIAQQEKSK